MIANKYHRKSINAYILNTLTVSSLKKMKSKYKGILPKNLKTKIIN